VCGVIAYLYNLVLHFTDRYMKHWVFSLSSIAISRGSLNSRSTCNYHLFSIIFTELNSRLTAHVELRNSIIIHRILLYNDFAWTKLKTPFPSNTPIVVYLPFRCLETGFLLLRTYSFPRECVYRTVV
jgi:hypothetical protein